LGIDLDVARGRPGRVRADLKPCFASTSRHEITAGGRKVVGSAQRIGKGALLQHGSIPLERDYLRVVEFMRLDQGARRRLARELENTTACLSDLAGRPVPPAEAAAALEEAFRSGLRGAGGDREGTGRRGIAGGFAPPGSDDGNPRDKTT
jgi:lipoate-protein ligase A